MNLEIKAQWVAALRSGDYEQGRAALCKRGRYCCLGVLGQLAADAGAVTRTLHRDRSEYLFDGEDALLPKAAAVWAGFSDEEILGIANRVTVMMPFVDSYDFSRVNLAAANDWGLTFGQIADLIEYAL